MSKLKYVLEKNKRKIIGLMSGTSCDGIDLALIEVDSNSQKFNFLKGYHKSYNKIEKKTILNSLDPQISNIENLSQINFYLAQIWADTINKMLKEFKISNDEIDLIGSHGQTIFHQPILHQFGGRQVRSTLQLGDPAVLAQLTGITTVGDFRVADVAVGGQGAPLVPYFDLLFFKRLKKDILVLNIGGISNITFIPKDGDINNVIALDFCRENIFLQFFLL